MKHLTIVHHQNEIHRLRAELVASRKREERLAVACKGLREIVAEYRVIRTPARIRWRLIAALSLVLGMVMAVWIVEILVN